MNVSETHDPSPPEFPPPTAKASPVYTPVPTYAPGLTSRRSGSGRTVLIVIAIGAGAVALLIGLGVVIYNVADSALSAFEGGSPFDLDGEIPELLPLTRGEPGPSTATIPLECPEQCFTEAAFESVLMGSFTYSSLGVPVEGEELDDEYAKTTADEDFLSSASYWKAEDSTPDKCFFTAAIAPTSDSLDGRPAFPDDPIRYHTDWYSESEYSMLSHTSRLFTTTDAAEEHMSSLLAQIEGCTSYTMGGREKYWAATVTPMPAIDLPNSVAAVGWVEEGYGIRYYTANLQRGNMAIRVSLSTDGEITEQDFRDYLWSAAEYLEGSIVR